MFTKVSLLSAYIFAHKFDIICLSETYVNSEIPSDDENLELAGYNLFKENIRKIFWGCLLLPVWNVIVNMGWMECNHICCRLSR